MKATTSAILQMKLERQGTKMLINCNLPNKVGSHLYIMTEVEIKMATFDTKTFCRLVGLTNFNSS